MKANVHTTPSAVLPSATCCLSTRPCAPSTTPRGPCTQTLKLILTRVLPPPAALAAWLVRPSAPPRSGRRACRRGPLPSPRPRPRHPSRAATARVCQYLQQSPRTNHKWELWLKFIGQYDEGMGNLLFRNIKLAFTFQNRISLRGWMKFSNLTDLPRWGKTKRVCTLQTTQSLKTTVPQKIRNYPDMHFPELRYYDPFLIVTCKFPFFAQRAMNKEMTKGWRDSNN